MTCFFKSLLSSSDLEVDSIIFAGLVALLVLIGLSVYATIQSPGAWNPITFATGAATTIASVAGGKTARDRWSAPPPVGGTDAPSPDK